MKPIRIMLSVVGLFMLVAVIAIAAFMMFMDPNKLKPVIINEVMKNTGYQLAIEGKLSWSFYPTLGVKVERMMLTDPHQTVPFLELRDVSIATELTKLLRGRQQMQGVLHIASMKLMNIQAENAYVGLHWEHQMLTLQPITASMYHGSVKGSAYGRDLENMPRWDWNVSFSQVQMKPLLQDVNGADSKLTIDGNADIKLMASTWGKNKAQLLNNLNGTTEFNLKNGIVSGVDLNYLLQTADALMNKQAVPALPTNVNQTAFDSFSGTAAIKNGVAETNNLLLNSSAFTTRGNGSINLPYEAINIQLQVTPQKEARTQWEIPVLIAGSMNHPDVRLDMLEIDKMVAKKEVDKVKEKVRQQIKEKVPGKAGEFLQGLIGS
jgi:uncharacterized protein involved in outer membrane biogenesis